MLFKPNRKLRICLIILCSIVLLACSLLPRLLTHAGSGECYGSALSSALRAVPDAVPDEELTLYAKAAVLMDADSGRILYEKNGTAVMPMASTTKIMTCILALENGDPEDYAEASSYAAGMPKVHLGVRAGEYFRLTDLLYSLMLESHNDSAVIIAEHIAGSTEAFAAMMNRKAAELGCTDTFFITPNGLDGVATTTDGQSHIHATTASDLARIMSYCITESPMKDEFLSITRTASYSFSGYSKDENGYTKNGRSFSCNNHNAFLSMMDGALSGKTGFTANAGYCYVGALTRDDRTFVVALLACGWPNNKTYKWSDTKKLMNYGLAHFEAHTLEESLFSESDLCAIPVYGAQTSVWGTVATETPYIARDEDFVHKKILLKEGEHFQVQYELASSLTAPVSEGQSVGEIRYYLNDALYYTETVHVPDKQQAIDLPYCIRQSLSHFLLNGAEE